MLSMQTLFGVPFFKVHLAPSEESQRVVAFLRQLREAGSQQFDFRAGLSNTGWRSPQWTDIGAPTELNWTIKHFREFLKTGLQQLLDHHLGDGARVVQHLDTDMVLWAIMNRKGDLNLRHMHTSSYRDTWSAVYYAHAPAGLDGGEIRFSNPNLAYRCALGTTLAHLGAPTMYEKLAPRTGDMVLFPSWLEHDVLPFAAQEERIVIAANMGVREMSAPRTQQAAPPQ